MKSNQKKLCAKQRQSRNMVIVSLMNDTALQLIGQGQKSKEWFIEQTKKAITAQLEKGAS